MRLGIDPEFFARNPLACAQELIGCVLQWGDCAGIIVETEAYEAVDDPACHTATRPSARAFIASHAPGTTYIYLNYGVHWLLNFLTKGEASAGFVLIRALEPLDGVERMRQRRGVQPDHLLCAGPGRLTQALGITGSSHAVSLPALPGGLFQGTSTKIIRGPRIGISSAKLREWRFGAADSRSLSRRFQP